MSAAEMMWIKKNIKHFRILEEIGEDETGVVYKALDTRLDVVRTMKRLKPDLVHAADALTRIERAVRRLTRLNHPGLVAVYGLHREPPAAFLVMEYVAGRTLAEILRCDGPLDPARAVRYAEQVLEALAYAHRKGVLHGDLRPVHILITDEDAVKLVGFEQVRRQEALDLPMTAPPDETLPYRSPEHVKSLAQVDARSDLYAVGVILYEALTGRTPFGEKETAYHTMRAILEEPPEPPADVSAEVSALVLRALAKDPDERFQSAAALRAALQAVALPASPPPTPIPASPPSEPSHVSPASAPPRAPRRRFARSVKTSALYLVVGIAVMVTVGLVGWVVAESLRSAQPLVELPDAPVAEVTIQPGVHERILSSVGPPGRGGMLFLRALPYGAIALEGGPSGQDSLEVRVEAGPQHVVFTHPAYGTQRVAVDVGPGQRKEVVGYFEGFLRVQASDKDGLPLQAELYVNDQRTGRLTSLEEPYPLPPGPHKVEVFLEGYLGEAAYVAVQPSEKDGMIAAPPVEQLELVLWKVD